LHGHSGEWAGGIGIYGDIDLAGVQAPMQLSQDFQLGRQIDFLGEYQEVNVAASGGIVHARSNKVNHRLRIGLMDGVADG